MSRTLWNIILFFRSCEDDLLCGLVLLKIMCHWKMRLGGSFYNIWFNLCYYRGSIIVLNAFLGLSCVPCVDLSLCCWGQVKPSFRKPVTHTVKWKKKLSSNLMNLYCWHLSTIQNYWLSFIFLPRNKLFHGCVLEEAMTDHLSAIKTDLALLLSSLQQKRFFIIDLSKLSDYV